MVIVQGFQLLDVHQHHRHVQILHGGEHIVGGGVGQELQKDQIHIRRPEQVARSLGLLLGCDYAAVHDVHRVRDGLFERFILCLELRH